MLAHRLGPVRLVPAVTCALLVATAVMPAQSAAGAVRTGQARPSVSTGPVGPATLPRLVARQVFRARMGYANTIVSVEATSRSDAWAVGTSNNGDHPRSYVVHWNGRAWRMVSLPVRRFLATSVQASSEHDVWLFGSAPGAGWEALRWDGAKWHAVTAPQVDVVRSVVLGPSDVWVSDTPTWTATGGWTTALWHWNGTDWISYPLRLLTDFSRFDIAGSSDRGVWAVGTKTSGSPAMKHAPERRAGPAGCAATWCRRRARSARSGRSGRRRP
jgi:hypothetical protein